MNIRKVLVALALCVAVVLAGCSNPSSQGTNIGRTVGEDVPKGSVITATYSGELYNGGGTRIVFDADGTVTFYDNGSASARAVGLGDSTVCARGTYVVTDNNIAQITITEVLNDWGDIIKKNGSGQRFSVAFDGNDLRITIGETSLFFSTDKKDVHQPSNGKLFSNNQPIDAIFVARQTLTLANGTFSITYNILYNFTEETVRGTYTQSGNIITINEPTRIGGEAATKAIATISGDTLTLSIEYAEENDTEKTVLKKRGTSWEHFQELTLSSNGDVNYYVNGEHCWKGAYTIIDAENASVKLKNVYIEDSFGTGDGKLYIEDADQNSLWLDLVDPDDSGGTAVLFAREI